MSRSIRSMLDNKKGVVALEYSILGGLILFSVLVALSTTNLGSSVAALFQAAPPAAPSGATTH